MSDTKTTNLTPTEFASAVTAITSAFGSLYSGVATAATNSSLPNGDDVCVAAVEL